MNRAHSAADALPPANRVEDRHSPTAAIAPALAPAAWRFLARLIAWYAVGLLLWIPLGAAFRETMLAVGNAIFAVAGRDHAVSFQALTHAKELGLSERVDATVLVHRLAWVDAEGRAQRLLAKGIVTFSQPYAATVFLLALFGATRMAWAARLWRGLVAGSLLVLLMAACVAIDVVFAFATNGASPGAMPRWLLEIVSVLHVSVTDWPAGVLIVPLLLWLLVCWPQRAGAARR